MKYTRSPFHLSGILLILISTAVLAFYGCGDDRQRNDDVMDKMHNTNGDYMDEEQMSGQEMPMLGEEVIHEGTIDVESIDKNKDGFVYQDHMDWNVLSDTEGKCPLCKMNLKQVNLNEAKENLITNGFNVSDNKK